MVKKKKKRTVYLTVAQAAALAGVSERTIRKNCKAGNLHAAGQIGASLGFFESDVKEWMQWREENPRDSRAWGWNGSGTPRPRGVPVKGQKK